jgi:spermidine synthase
LNFQSDKDKFRRLIFLANQAVVQSEALIRSTKSNKNKKGSSTVDITYLACDHHRLMSMGPALFAKPEVLLIGLGGGGLCTFLNRCFPTVRNLFGMLWPKIHVRIFQCLVTAVEIDSAMLSLAQTYFGLVLSDRLKVEIQDGLQFIKKSSDSG